MKPKKNINLLQEDEYTIVVLTNEEKVTLELTNFCQSKVLIDKSIRDLKTNRERDRESLFGVVA